MNMHTRSFTIIEVVIAVLIVAILAIIAIPKFIDMSNKAKENSEDYVAGAVRQGISGVSSTNFAKRIKPIYPQMLDSGSIGPASPSNPLFGNVMNPLSSEWTKLEDLRYRGPTGREYVYDKDAGTFMLASAGGGDDGGGEDTEASFAINPGIKVNDFTLTAADVTTQVTDVTTSYKALALSALSFNPIIGIPSLTDMGGTYGTDLVDEAMSVQQTTDGGYIVVGYILDTTTYISKALVMKLKPDGTLEWAETFKNPNFGRTEAASVQQTSDGGFIIGGLVYPSNVSAAGATAMAIKLDSSGNRLWSNVYDTHGTAWSQGSGIIKEASDGTLVMVAGYNSTWVTKLNPATGAVIPGSAKLYNDPNFSNGGSDSSFEITSDGGCIITAGATALKLDAGGTAQWCKSYGTNRILAVQQTQDGGFVMSGVAADKKGYVLKVDSSGNIGINEWSKTYAVADTGRSNYAYAVSQTSDGNYIVGGWINSAAAAYTGYLSEIDSNGNFVWGKHYGSGRHMDRFFSADLTSGGGIVAAGISTSTAVPGAGNYYNVLVVKTDSEGNVTR